MATLVNGSWAQGNGLVVRNVAPAFSFAGQDLGVEGRCDDGVYQDVVVGVNVVLRWYVDEDTVAGCVAVAVRSAALVGRELDEACID